MLAAVKHVYDIKDLETACIVVGSLYVPMQSDFVFILGYGDGPS